MHHQGTYYSLCCLLGHNPTVHSHVLATEVCTLLPPKFVVKPQPSVGQYCVTIFWDVNRRLFIPERHWWWIKETSQINSSSVNREFFRVAYKSVNMVTHLYHSKPQVLPKHGWQLVGVVCPSVPVQAAGSLVARGSSLPCSCYCFNSFGEGVLLSLGNFLRSVMLAVSSEIKTCLLGVLSLINCALAGRRNNRVP